MGENDPDSVLLKVTDPVGVLGVPVSVSLTVAVHVMALPTAAEVGEHDTDVLVNRNVVTTASAVNPELVECVASPP